MIINDSVMAIMTKIGKAVEKGATEDTREYLRSSDNVTNNAVAFLRGDYINTNLSTMVANENIDVKLFKRSSWTGALVIDRENQLIFSVCSRKTLDRIPKNKTRRSPHYIQTILNTINKDEIAPVKQMSLVDFSPSFITEFTDDDYEKDFLTIMEEAVIFYEGYRLGVITYEVERFNLTDIAAVLMDGDFDTVQEVSIIEMLKPDFGMLTLEEPEEKKKKDVRSLISIKSEVFAEQSSEPEKRTEILPKSVEESKKA